MFVYYVIDRLILTKPQEWNQMRERENSIYLFLPTLLLENIKNFFETFSWKNETGETIKTLNDDEK